MQLAEAKKQHIQDIVEDIYRKSCSEYSFEDFARKNRLYRIRDEDMGHARSIVSALLFPMSGGYALLLDEEDSLEEKMKVLGHDVGHIVLDHYRDVNVEVGKPINISVSSDPDSVEETEANYFEELWYDKFSGNNWIDMEKLKDFRIYKNKLQEFWFSDNWFAMMLKSVVGHLRNLVEIDIKVYRE